MLETIARLHPPWISEHLSFSSACIDGGTVNTSFLLPPRQSQKTVALAARNISRIKAAFSLPVAFETGVNYLRPQANDMPDGEFFGAIATQANCGIVLDLHDLWCNQLNGSGKVLEVLRDLPLERVWEVHLAGGQFRNGYMLDAHFGTVSPELMALASEVIPQLPSLKALVFEITPDYMEAEDIGIDELAAQVMDLRTLWRSRRSVQLLPAGRISSGRLAVGAAPEE
jgi:uncharacterized protein (UPF0276 family)